MTEYKKMLSEGDLALEPVRNEVDEIEFNLLDSERIKDMSVVKITTPQLYDTDGYPVDSGLMDLKMGVINPSLKCRTCGEGVNGCPGHFGYIDLARPVIHVRYARWIYRFLACTCQNCNRLKMSEEDIKKFKKKFKQVEKERGERKKWDLVRKVRNKSKHRKICSHCGERQDKIKFEKPYTFFKGGDKLTSIDVREYLKNVSREDARLLGLHPDAGKPEDMVLTVIPVPPVQMRPSITLESGERSEDDLTHKFGDVIRTNQRLYENLNAGAPEVIIQDLWDLLQYHVATTFDNSKSQIPPARHRSRRKLKTLKGRIKGKQGRFRKNLVGKRVNYSARTVISPDSNIALNEVGVPKEMAMELTIPERVNEWNIDHLKEYIERGPDNYPGANYVITNEGKRKKITEETKETLLEELAPGFVVERHLKDGDISLFNRQPSLHRMSIMAHRVKILPYKTLRLNLATVVPYNADFDGDEMNLHIPQTEEARAEAELLLDVKENLITPRYGLPIIGCSQDHVSGNYVLTHGEKLFTKKEAADLLSSASVYEFDLDSIEKDGKEYYTGKQIFSMILPEGINLEAKADICNCSSEDECDHDAYVKIEDSVLKKGTIDEKMIGPEAGKGKLLQEIVRTYDTDTAIQTIKRIADLGIAALQKKGFTVLPSDTDIPDQTIDRVKNLLDNLRDKTDDLIQDYEEGKIRPSPGKDKEEAFENKIVEKINQTRNKIDHIIRKGALSQDKKNYVLEMARSGARGSINKYRLMSGSVGQVRLRGSRIKRGYEGNTLPHFDEGDLGLKPHGFIRHSYKGGLDPYEFFFNAMTGRDTIMDTSMRTPKSGYMQRRLINALQDLMVEYDGTVRDGGGDIIQFEYGEDSLDLTKSNNGEVMLPHKKEVKD